MPNSAPLITRLALQAGLDPQAVLAVARGEGGLQNRADDIGDLSGGGSYGPFQLYTKGALPKQYHGRPQAADQWAWSPAGISYALGKMAETGARGLTGANAVKNIITRFERPANPNRSISAALARLGGGSTGAEQAPSGAAGVITPITPAQVQSTQTGGFRNLLLQGLIKGEDPYSLITRAHAAAPTPTPTPGVPPNAVRSAPTAPQTVPVVKNTQDPVSPNALPVIKEAYKFLGTPYSWGGGNTAGPSKGFGRGASTVGFDCSSFIQYLNAKQGKQVPRVTYDQWRTGSAVPPAQLQAGDAVFFHPGERGPEHVGMYIGHGQFIEAPKTGDVIKISKLADRPDFMGARRY